MSSLGEILTARDIALDVEASSKDAVLRRLAALLARPEAGGTAQIFDVLAARERLGSTALGHGVALPHARLGGLVHDVAAFVRTREAVPFDAPDARPVRCFLALLVPAHAVERHLQLLAQAALLLDDRSFRESLRCAEAPADVIALFGERPVARPGP